MRTFHHPKPYVRGFWFVATALVLFAPVAYVGFTHINDLRAEQALLEEQDNAASLAKSFSNQLDLIKHLGITLGLDRQLQLAIAKNNQASAERVLQNFMTQVKDPFIQRVTMVEANGDFFADFPQLPGVINASQRDWYKAVVATEQPYLSQIYKRSASPQINLAAFAIPFFDVNQKLTGILTLQLNLAYLVDWSNTFSNKNNQVYIIDQNGQVVTGPDFSLEGPILNLSNTSLITDLTKGQMGLASTFVNPLAQNQVSFAATHPIPNYKWGVVITQSKQSALAPDSVSGVLRNGVLFLIGLLAISLFILGTKNKPRN